MFDEYSDYLYALGRKPKTVKAYTNTMKRVVALADADGIDLLTMKPLQVMELAEHFKNTPASRAQLKCAIQHWWAMHHVAGPGAAVPVPKRARRGRGKWKGLEDAQVSQLLAVARGDWPRGAVIYLGVYLGLRREEIARCRWADFDEKMEWVTVLGKGGYIREMPVPGPLRTYLLLRRWPSEYVFPGRLGSHVTGTTISNWVSEMGHAAGLGHIHPHQLRYTSGGKVHEISGDLETAQEWLGHANPSTTQIYTRFRRDRLLVAAAAFDWEPDEPDPAPDSDRLAEVVQLFIKDNLDALLAQLKDAA